MKIHSTYSKWNMYCFGETIMLRTEQFPILWMNCLLQSTSSSCRHCIWMCPAKFTDGGREGWLLNNRNSTTMPCAKLCPSFLSVITHCCVDKWFLLAHSADVPALSQWFYRSSADVDYADQVGLCSHHISTCGAQFIKAIPMCILRWLCSAVCSWGSAHTFGSCVSRGKVCLCRGGCSLDLCLLQEHTTANDGCNTSGTLGDEPFGGDN